MIERALAGGAQTMVTHNLRDLRSAALGKSAGADTPAMSGGMDRRILTIRLPNDTAQRLNSLTRSRGLSMNKLVEQLSASTLSAWDNENRFRATAATGDVRKALAVLDRLTAVDAAG